MVAEEIAVTEMEPLAEVAKNASSVTSMVTLHVNARKIRIFATVAMALDTLQKTVNRLVTR